MSEEKEDGWLIGWIGKIFELPGWVIYIYALASICLTNIYFWDFPLSWMWLNPILWISGLGLGYSIFLFLFMFSMFLNWLYLKIIKGDDENASKEEQKSNLIGCSIVFIIIICIAIMVELNDDMHW